MKTQFEVRIIDTLKAGLVIVAVIIILKVVCLDGAHLLAGYSMGLAICWGILLLAGTLFISFKFAEVVSSDPMLLTVAPDGLTMLNLHNNRELRVSFKQMVSYRFLEHFISEELKLSLEGRTISLTAYNFAAGGKDFRAMVHEFEAAASRYNQQPAETHIIRREAPFLQGKSFG